MYYRGFTEEYKEEMLKKFRSSNMSCTEFAKSQGIAKQTLWNWINADRNNHEYNLSRKKTNRTKVESKSNDSKKLKYVPTRKNNKYTPEFKREIMDKYKSGYAGVKILAKEYGISFHTIKTWLRMEQEGKNIYNTSKKGRSGRKLNSEIDYKTQVEILKKMEEFLKLQQEIK